MNLRVSFAAQTTHNSADHANCPMVYPICLSNERQESQMSLRIRSHSVVITIGIGIGASIGVALDNVALGTSIGAAVN